MCQPKEKKALCFDSQNKALVGTLMTIGDVKDIFPIVIVIGFMKGVWCFVRDFIGYTTCQNYRSSTNGAKASKFSS